MQGSTHRPKITIFPLQNGVFFPSTTLGLDTRTAPISNSRVNPRFHPSPMLKLLSSSCIQNRAQHALTKSVSTSCVRDAIERQSSLFGALNSLRGLARRTSSSGQRAFFCSDSSGGPSDAESETSVDSKSVELEAEVGEKASSAIVSTYPRPEDYPTVGYCIKECRIRECCNFLIGELKQLNVFPWTKLDNLSLGVEQWLTIEFWLLELLTSSLIYCCSSEFKYYESKDSSSRREC